MEFRFKTDFLSNSYRVDFSMGHEAFGHWLLNELGNDQAAIEQLLVKIELIKTERDVEELIEGRDFSLTLTEEDAIVMANSLHLEGELPQGEDMSHYDAESFSQCGIEDFESMIQSWQEFI
ncbi:YacL family protein [Psychrobium sp. 1_MG-2023]|uniref:UPF0231 family protein n=1 Tax=Psychrobium sp. 1_MG-2023 TaxID=3062624 RepID=UPI000C3489E2|nr:YacL family protein [Psychrobium sp. 1_MG-2023]MDP2559608.1 YacL family protein [Psychrobium sp. 1_MG-2023]PKF59442.1 hypothetical protein CW748_01330 [Alteromonadales bacterium alter-6D02]